MLTFIDLFAGIGGFHQALKANGATCVLSCEWDTKAKQVYELNYGSKAPLYGDIADLAVEDIPAHDILCAGFPCQPFSIAGHQKGFAHPTQGTLFFELERIIKAKQPSVVFLENVKNLKSHDKGNTFKVILSVLSDLGYYVKEQVLDADVHGNLPQNRERIYIVGFRDKVHFEKFEFPKPVPLTCKLVPDIIDLNAKAPDKYYQTNESSPSVSKMLAGMPKLGVIYQYRRYYMRENKSGVCPTLTANMGTGGHNVPLIRDSFGVRKLTPRECLRLQGFADDFKIPVGMSDASVYKQAGNSVPVPVVARIAKCIVKALG